VKVIPAREFESLFLERRPLIDVRAPVEFAAGSIPGAVNLPLLNDEERHAVGLTYKEKGQAAAIELGHRLIQGQTRELRVAQWLKRIEAAPSSAVFCFRGGLRSQIAQEWIYSKGAEPPLVAGGFKALRRFLLAAFTEYLPKMRFEVVTGPTGAGKTEFLKKSGRPFLDLEGLANHRGSAFGEMETPQPTQVDFENAIAAELIRLSHSSEPILIENESRMVGLRAIPAGLFQKILTSPVFEITVSLEERVENIFKAYVLESKLGTRGDAAHFKSFRRSVAAISRKLGGARSQEILADLERAESQFRLHGKLDLNREWIRKLLIWYYDPRYSYPRK
jgi:tRNA 2-selenouridine synthase